MSVELLFTKRAVTQKFYNTTFEINDSIPLDEEIKDFVYELNKRKYICTTNSCAGHGTYGNSPHPYLAFLVSEPGWELFWSSVLPAISSKVLVHIHIIEEGDKVSIVIRSHYEDKNEFWDAVKQQFLYYFDVLK
jgi:hypothetical protein